MQTDLNAFEFTDGVRPTEARVGCIARVPAGLQGNDELFDALQMLLEFPYFGRNWNALSDCLRDLEWLPDGEIILQHLDCPALSEKDLEIYLDVLAHAQASFRKGERHSLRVVFPSEVRSAVLDALRSAKRAN